MSMSKGLTNLRPLSSCSSLLSPSGLSNRDSPPTLRSVDAFRPSFPVSKLTALLDHDNHDMRNKFRKFLSDDPLMVPRYNIRLEDERELALKRLKAICDGHFISVLDFWNNPLRIFAAHELAAVVDPVGNRD